MPPQFSRIFRLSIQILCLIAMLQGSQLWSQCVEDDLQVFGINPGDRVGRSVAVSGGRVFVGAIGDDGGGFLSGSVRSFRRGVSGYQLEHVFSGLSGAEYGSSLAADENWLAIGAIGLGYIESGRGTVLGGFTTRLSSTARESMGMALEAVSISKAVYWLSEVPHTRPMSVKQAASQSGG